MMNIVRITDGAGNKLGRTEHGRSCFSVATHIAAIRTSRASPAIGTEEFVSWVEEAIEKASDAESVILQVFLYAWVELTSADIPIVEDAIKNYPMAVVEGPKLLLKKYLALLKKHGTIRLECTDDSYSALTITSDGINPD